MVRVITFRDYQYDDGHSTADVHVPELGGSGAADEINDQVQAYTDQLIAQFQTDCEAAGESYQGLDVTSSVVADASLSYLTDEFTAIDPEQSFYWNADGDLVLVFDEYAVAAGYMGMVEFTIPQDVYSALLK